MNKPLPLKTKKAIFVKMKEIENEYQENKESYDDIFKKCMDGLGDIDEKKYGQLILWTLEDWVDFIPYFTRMGYGNSLDCYRRIAKRIISKDILKRKHDYDYYWLCLKWWTEAQIPDLRWIYNGMVLDRDEPFHASAVQRGMDDLESACVHCLAKCPCQLQDRRMGPCGKKMTKCFPGAGLHLCSTHGAFVVTEKKNIAGLSEVYALNDERTVRCLPVLWRLYHVKGLHFYISRPAEEEEEEEEEI